MGEETKIEWCHHTFNPWIGAPVRILLRDPKGGDPSEWPPSLRIREFPEVA